MIELPSGAKLDVKLAPFSDSKALLQAFLEEIKAVKMAADTQLDVNLFKDLFCAGFSSPKVEAALTVCMNRCLYNGLRIDRETFESAEARQDYMLACFEVAKENVAPFTKGLYAKYSTLLASLKDLPA